VWGPLRSGWEAVESVFFFFGPASLRVGGRIWGCGGAQLAREPTGLSGGVRFASVVETGGEGRQHFSGGRCLRGMKLEPVSGLERLLRNEGWANRLARTLVRDEHEATDVLQEARVVAWRSPSHEGGKDGGRDRSWLSVVIRNLVRNRHRGARRRAAVEREAGERAALERAAVVETDGTTPQAVVERLELQRMLLDLVSGLRPAYREVVVLRYYEGLSAATIARSLDVPAGTVRWRLREALRELRATLDERHGGRKTWVIALVPLAEVKTGAIRRAMAVRAVATLAGSAALIAAVAAIVHSSSIVWEDGATERTLDVVDDKRTASMDMVRSAPRWTSSNEQAAGEVKTKATTESMDTAIPLWARAEGFADHRVAGVVLRDGQPVAGAGVRLSPGNDDLLEKVRPP
jgi:RNA polymerase sigma factor (sigma-70 family)